MSFNTLRHRAGLSVAAFILSCLPAAAADLDYLRPTSQDSVPLDEVTWTTTARVWASTGSTRWAHDASSASPVFGSPTSRLQYDKLDGWSGEAEVRGDEATGVFGKALAGFGAIGSGSLRDQDWFSGQVLFSDTSSLIDNGHMGYFSIDGGTRIDALSRGPLRTNGFLGYGYWTEKVAAVGGRCNADDVGNAFCPLGVDVIAPGAKAISNEVQWHMLRIGAEAALDLGPYVTLSGEAAVIPIGYLYNEDSHHLRFDLGAGPNVTHSAAAFGIQTQAFIDVHPTQNWSFGVGARYWRMDTYDRRNIRFAKDEQLPLMEFASERYGLLAHLSAKF